MLLPSLGSVRGFCLRAVSALGAWVLCGAALVGGTSFAATGDDNRLKRADLPAQHVRLVDDFDGDGKADVIWQDASNVVHLSRMNRTTVVACRQLGVLTDRLIGSGDFNGDGRADTVWRNMTTGAVRIGFFNGDSIYQWMNVGSSPIALEVKLEGIGDFYGHGRPNMLWRNQATGRTVLSYHNSNGSLSYWATVSEFINPADTTALKVGDINGDGKADVVWRNMGTGNVVLSLMNGATPTWRQITSTPISPSVKLESIGDFDGNGRADLLWRNTTTGRSVMSFHQLDGSVASWPVVSNYINPATTDAQAVGDFSGDGRDDILWRNLTTGNTVISVMNGSLPSWESASFSSCSTLPHTGITASQCYLGGSSAFVTCIAAYAEPLYTNTSSNFYRYQDGHRRMINAKSYSLVSPSGVGPYAFQVCVKDNNTGLYWRQPNAVTPSQYTNLGTGGILDTSGLVAAVNAGSLCGFNDWRLPTINELLTLIDYGSTTNPRVDTAWIAPGGTTGHAYHWSSEIGNAIDTGSTTTALVVSFNKFDDAAGEGFAGGKNALDRDVLAYAKLVRGNARAAPRFNYSTVAYGGDAANNLVNDAWTGLQWRRCLSGATWTGSVCTGEPGYMTHEQALVFARQQTGWRLPNVTEIGSLYDRSVSGYLNPAVFPSINSSHTFWTTTPWADNPDRAWLSHAYYGAAVPTHRSTLANVRMLRESP